MRSILARSDAEYKKIGKKRYSELIDTEIGADLRDRIYMVYAHRRICVICTCEEKETPQTPLMVGVFMSQRRDVGEKCGRRELMGFRRGEIEERSLNPGSTIWRL